MNWGEETGGENICDLLGISEREITAGFLLQAWGGDWGDVKEQRERGGFADSLLS
jgi:hypothetical protein